MGLAMTTRTPPRILAIAGSDSSGGAGIQADLKTIAMLGGYGMTAITAVTAQNSVGVQGIAPMAGDMVADQIASCVSDIGVDAVKIGMLHDADIIAHNAPFDFGFLDAELFRCQRPPLDRRRMIDSLAMAKLRYPGMPNNLDALCRRLGVDNSMRGSHNAILDCQLLAQVYLEMMGGKQPGLGLAAKAAPLMTLGCPLVRPISRATATAVRGCHAAKRGA